MKEIPKEEMEVDDEYVIERYSEVVSRDVEHWKAQHNEWSDYYRLYGGETLTSEDREYLIGTRRLPVELSMSTGILNTVIGLDQGDRREVQFLAESNDTLAATVSGWMTDLTRRAIVRCDGHRAFGDAGLDCAIVGMGALEVYLDGTKVPHVPKVRPILPWEVFVDRKAHGPNFDDKRHVTWRRRISLREFASRWPDSDGTQAHALIYSDQVPVVVNANKDRESDGDTSDRDAFIEVDHFEFERFEPSYYVTLPQGGRAIFAKYELNERREQFAAAGIDLDSLPMTEYRRRVIYRSYISRSAGAGKVLEVKRLSFPRFTIETPTCFRRRDVELKKTFVFGLGSVMYDAQRFVNLGFRIILESLSRASKVGGFIEKRALESMPGGDVRTKLEHFQRVVSTPGAWAVLANGSIANGSIMVAQPPTFPQGFDRLLQILIELLGKLTGVTEYLQGTSNRERAAVLVNNLQSQSMVMLSPLFDGINLARINVGKVIASIIIRHVEAGWIDRFLKEPVPGVTHQQDPQTGELIEVAKPSQILSTIGDLDDFEVVADVGVASMTARVSAWETMTNTAAFQTLMGDQIIGPELVPLMIKNMPLQGGDPIRIAARIEEKYRAQEAMQTAQGVMDVLMQMDPQQREAIIQQVAASSQAAQNQEA